MSQHGDIRLRRGSVDKTGVSQQMNRPVMLSAAGGERERAARGVEASYMYLDSRDGKGVYKLCASAQPRT